MTVAGCLAFQSLVQIGTSSSELITLGGLEVFALAERFWIAAALAVGAILAALTRLRPVGRTAGAAAAQAAAPDRAAAIGALGEALVAGDLRRAGCAVLRNVIMPAGAGWTEIDMLARTQVGILVVEVKTWSGRIVGDADAAEWVREGGRGPQPVLTALQQNRRHVRAVCAYIGDGAVRVDGMVVSAGHARFAAGIAGSIATPSDLPTILRGYPGDVSATRDELDRAWGRLEEAAIAGEGLREAHAAFVRRQKAYDKPAM